jgi:type VI protein secretion system component Hcp
MALEQFIEITGVSGEATAPDVHDAIPVLAWSFGITHPEASPDRPPPGPGAADPAGGRASFSGFRFSKRVDSSTPVLMDLCARGVSTAQARLVVRGTGQRDPRVIVDLRDVIVTEVGATFDQGAGDLLETVVLQFGRVWFGGALVDRRGASGQVNWFAWDVTRNTAASGD